MELQKVSPGIMLPYWDYTLDSQSPETSEIWRSFGSMGDANTCCVNDGAFKGWIASDGQCLKRSGEKIIASFYSPEQIFAVCYITLNLNRSFTVQTVTKS
jgi:hypothetical protein